MIVFAAALAMATSLPAQAATLTIGSFAPLFTLPDIHGRAVALRSFAGRPVVLFFTSSNGAAGVDKIPAVAAFVQKHRSKRYVLIVVDLYDSPSQATRFAREWKLPEPFLTDQTGSTAASYHVLGTPTVVVIDRRAKIQAYRVGAMRADEIEAILKRIP
jgi:peroxiredoxin